MKNIFNIFFKLFFLTSFFTSPAFASPDFIISVKKIIEEFESNSIVAEEKFLKKKIKLTNGEINSIDDSIFSDDYVTVTINPRYEEYSLNFISCSHKRDSFIIRKLKKGMEVDVVGILKSESTGLTFNNCFYFSKDFKDSASKLFRQALEKRTMKDYSGAINDFSTIIEYFDNTNPVIYFNRGITQGILGNSNAEMNDLNKAIELKPKYSDPYFARGVRKAGLKDVSGAINDYTNYIKNGEMSYPMYIAYFNRGLAHNFLKNFNAAINDFNKAIELNPKYAKGFHHRGISKYFLKNKFEACKDFQKAVSLGREISSNLMSSCEI